jgi:transposase
MIKSQMIKLSKEERIRVREIADCPKTTRQIRRRANILLLLDRNVGRPMLNEEIAERCGVTRQTVWNIVNEYHAIGIEDTLKYKKTKPRRPLVVTGDVEARIIALACGKPPEGHGKWTVRLLARHVVELDILEAVSRETVRTTLKKRNLSLT